MKKTLTLFIVLSFLSTAALFAQTDQRTVTTKIADLLARIPAANAYQLEAANEAIGGMGAEALQQMASMLTAPGQGDNTNVEYALKSFSYYVVQPGKEAWRNWSSAAYCNALDKTTDKTCKAFLISQLQITGKDEAVPCLSKYLDDEQLCDVASRALVKINTPASAKALLDKLKTASDARSYTLVEALGDASYKEAAPAITALINKGDKKMDKVGLYALAHIADASSATTMQAAAAKAGYIYDVSDATASYLLYIKETAKKGNTAIADKAALALAQKAIAPTQLHTRTAALYLLTQIRKEKSMPLLMAAVSDKQPAYRIAALKFAAPYLTDASSNAWVTKLATVSNEPKAEIITMLGNQKISSALPGITSALKSTNEKVKLAAIAAIGKVGNQQSIAPLLAIMKQGNTEEVAAVKQSLLTIKADDIATQAAAAMPSMPSNAKAALLEVLAAKGADTHLDEALALTKTNDTIVSKAAFGSLANLSTASSLPALFSLLKTVDQPAQVNATQDALIAGLNSIPDTTQRLNTVLNELKQATAEKQYLFFPLLASVANKQALQVTSNAFTTGSDQTKTAVIEALSNWTNTAATEPLYQIAKQSAGNGFAEASINGYLKLTSTQSIPADQKLLMLRRIMDVTQATAQKQAILKQVGRCNTLIALIYAGNYLDDAAVKNEAALAVMSIALANQSLYGDVVKKLLEKSITILQGQDSDYIKQAVRKHLAEMPAGEGFVAMFNGSDLTGWKGLVANPVVRAKMNADTLAAEQQKANTAMQQGWVVKDGLLVFTGHGDNLCTEKKYGDFEMFVDWKITKDGDAGIYLRGSPQVQIWDTSRLDVGAQVGSGGLYNNQANPSKPLVLADNAIGEWNSFHIIMKGEKVTVYLNGQLVVDNTTLENYWDRKIPIFPQEQIELQAHGTYVAYRDLYIREIESPKPFELSAEEKTGGYKILFDGTNLDEWTGNKTDYSIEEGAILVNPKNGGHGNLYTKDEYSDFVYRFEFKLTPGANNGIGIRAPLEGDAAYVGMEIQVLDNEAAIYRNLHVYQYHGSVYGVIPAKRGYLKPVGEWNTEEITAIGNKIKVVLNGTTILEGDIAEASKNGTADGKEHPGLKNTKGHIGFLGHGDTLSFRNIRIKDLSK